MSIDPTTPRSRRAVLGAALGAAAATAANAVAQPSIAAATDGQPVIQGADNAGGHPTIVRNSVATALEALSDATSGAAHGLRGITASPSGTGVTGQSPGVGVRGDSTSSTTAASGVFGTAAAANGIGVRGSAPHGRGVHGVGGPYGVFGESPVADGRGVFGSAVGDTSIGTVGVSSGSTGVGVLGAVSTTQDTATGVVGRAQAGTGVHGWVGDQAVVPAPDRATGVYGRSDGNTARGVSGFSDTGIGVVGATKVGAALAGIAADPAGVALRVVGTALFSRSGRAVVPSGQSQVQVNGVRLAAGSLVVATIQGVGEADLYVRSVSLSVANSRFTIRLSKAASANTPVGWFIVN